MADCFASMETMRQTGSEADCGEVGADGHSSFLFFLASPPESVSCQLEANESWQRKCVTGLKKRVRDPRAGAVMAERLNEVSQEALSSVMGAIGSGIRRDRPEKGYFAPFICLNLQVEAEWMGHGDSHFKKSDRRPRDSLGCLRRAAATQAAAFLFQACQPRAQQHEKLETWASQNTPLPPNLLFIASSFASAFRHRQAASAGSFR